MENIVYARLKDGKIAEYPVFAIHIKNRAHPLDWYTPVIYLEKPEYDKRYQSLKEELQITGNYVIASYNIKPLSVNTMLNNLFYPNGRINITNPGEQVEPEEISIADVDQDLFAKIVERVSFEVGQSLDTFVVTRGYDDVKSCASYVNSSNPQFQAEATRTIALRDQTYTNLYTYLDTLISGTNPLPKSFNEIKVTANLPELTWE